MRSSLLLALLPLAACAGDATRSDSTGAATAREPDPIVLRVPRTGGTARAAIYPAIDSVIWRAAQVPALERILGFDVEAGVVAVATRTGRPAHLDLRLGRFTVAFRGALRSVSSANGSDIFGIDSLGRALRFSPVGTWSLTPPRPASWILPHGDGSAIIAATSREETTLWRVQPPDDRILDTAFFPALGSTVRTHLGNRVYFAAERAIIAVDARSLEPVSSIRIRERVVAAVPTPSGDRLYVASHGTDRLRVISRFSDDQGATVRLPDEASDLRMDPLGRYVLARAAGYDSVWVVAIGTGRVVATLPTRWAVDLPAVAPDGAVATLAGDDVVFFEPETTRARARVRGGARDLWFFFFWNGFRPRARGIDAPVTFDLRDTLSDSAASGDSVPRGQDAGAHDPVASAAAPFTLSFAASLSRGRADALADSIAVGGVRARVVTSQRAGPPLYRVVLGPYTTRQQAETVGKASERSYWIFEGPP